MTATETSESLTLDLLRQMDRRLDSRMDRLDSRMDRLDHEIDQRFYWLVGILLTVVGLLVRLSCQ